MLQSDLTYFMFRKVSQMAALKINWSVSKWKEREQFWLMVVQ